jgi:hypothetical protein
MRQHINLQNIIILTNLLRLINVQLINVTHVIHQLETHFIERVERKGKFLC